MFWFFLILFIIYIVEISSSGKSTKKNKNTSSKEERRKKTVNKFIEKQLKNEQSNHNPEMSQARLEQNNSNITISPEIPVSSTSSIENNTTNAPIADNFVQELKKQYEIELSSSRTHNNQQPLKNSSASKKEEQIKSFLKKRNINYLVHFTNAKNLSSILKHGLMTRVALNKLDTNFAYNDNLRLDDVTNSISLSISFPNYRMFYKYRKNNPNTKWIVLLLDSSIAWEYPCEFCYVNAADRRIIHTTDRASLTTVESLVKMFDRGEDNSTFDLEYKIFTTDPQAEILVKHNIPIDKLKYIVFEDDELHNDFLQSKLRQDWLPENVTSVVNKHYFKSRDYITPKQLFN